MREAIDAKNKLETEIYNAEKMPTEYKDKITDEDAENIKKAVESAKEVLKDESADKEKYEEASTALNAILMPIGAKIYRSGNTDASNNEQTGSDKSSDEPVEGEVVE